MVAAHANSLRSIIMYLEKLTSNEVESQFPTRYSLVSMSLTSSIVY